jgi:general secretion pathway protein D
VLPLQHADAVELVKTLNDIVGTGGGAGGGAKPGGAPAVNTSVFEGTIRLSADKSTNSIVVTSSLRDYGSLRAVVDRLDQARRQVFIDAVIMDLAVSRTDSFGMRFHGGSAFGLQSANDTLLFGGLDMGKTISLDPSVLQGAALGIRGPGIEGSQNLIPGLGLSIPAFGATLTALTTTSDTDVLSTPHILATDNIPAEISIGENVPIQQNVGLGSLSSLAGAAGSGAAGALSSLSALGGLGGGGTAARADVGTKIKIIPHLNESNEARLEITEEISEARKPEGVSQVVPITRRTANTTLTVKDQQTVVIGGLMRNRVAHGTTKIPLLGDIPLLGALFRQTTTEMQKTNLVLILTPYIIRDQSDLRRVFERKMQERQEFLDRYFVFNESQKYVPPTDYSRTNGLLEEIRQAYASVDEKKRLEEITKPKELRGHPPQTPLEMPAGASRAKGGAGGESGKPANLNLAAPPKSVERVEK